MTYSVDFSLIQHTDAGRLVLRKKASACFAVLRSPSYVSREVIALGGVDCSAQVIIKDYPYTVYNEKIPRIIYHVNSKVKKEVALNYLDGVMGGFGFDEVLPKQTSSSILRRGLVIDTTRASGNLIMAILGLVRNLDEEIRTVNAYEHIIKLKNMDPCTAIVLAHSLKKDGAKFELYGVGNSGHTTYRNCNNIHSLKEAWSRVWKIEEKELKSWYEEKRYANVQSFIAPKGNSYTEKSCLFTSRVMAKEEVQNVLDTKVYPIRDAIYNKVV